ncbi:MULTISPECIES: hypothetical protein [unclassified Oceanobacillus]|uniref:hypothetical protein n=1 Tax=unclassified Oceanobacillus TaxID=2630292 RepID=UPI00300DF6C0
MKVELKRELIPWSIVNKGIHGNKSYKHINGEIYSFKQMSGRARHINAIDNLIKENKFSRTELIDFLSQNLEQVINLKLQITDQRLREYQLSPKALGDDLYFLTESYHRKNNLYNGKYSMADFITPKALHILQEREKAKLIFEHMVPKNLYLKPLVKKAKQGNLKYTEIYSVLMKFYYTCTVTKDEDNLLPSAKMQDGWDEQNPFFRYQLAGIHFIENPKSFY